MKEKELFKEFVSTLLHSWGSDTPPEAIWAFNDITEWLEAEYKIKIPILEEDLENLDIVMDEIEKL